jgi:hypothetical protein
LTTVPSRKTTPEARIEATSVNRLSRSLTPLAGP